MLPVAEGMAPLGLVFKVWFGTPEGRVGFGGPQFVGPDNCARVLSVLALGVEAIPAGFIRLHGQGAC
eukprot:11195025-Lingulodinium_polyedra.AAC.1